jgi:hypothetical protein
MCHTSHADSNGMSEQRRDEAAATPRRLPREPDEGVAAAAARILAEAERAAERERGAEGETSS